MLRSEVQDRKDLMVNSLTSNGVLRPIQISILEIMVYREVDNQLIILQLKNKLASVLR